MHHCTSHLDCAAGHFCFEGGGGCELCHECAANTDSFDGRCPQDRCPGTPTGGAGLMTCGALHDGLHADGSEYGCTQNAGCCYEASLDHCHECAAGQPCNSHPVCNHDPLGQPRIGWFCAKWGCDMCDECMEDADSFDDECPMAICGDYGGTVGNIITAADSVTAATHHATCAGATTDFPQAQKWVIRNTGTIDDHWVLDELEFFSDEACTVELTTPTRVTEAIYSCLYAGEDLGFGHDPASQNRAVVAALTDDMCTADCGAEDVGQWAGCDSPRAQQTCGSYVGFAFNEPVTVRCIRACQCSCARHRAARAVCHVRPCAAFPCRMR